MRWCGTKYYFPVILVGFVPLVVKLLGLKKGKKGQKRAKSSRFLFICIKYCKMSLYGSWLQIPYTISKS